MADKDDLQPHTSNTSNVEVEQKPKKRGGIINHYKRWWWVHVIVIIVLVLVITLPVVYVGYPEIAQNDVNKSRLNITSMSILNPTPDSFDLEITSRLTNKAMYHPDLYPFTGDLYLGDASEPFSSIPVPKVKANNGAVSNINTHSIINNTALFTAYTTAVLKQENVTLQLRGKTKLKQGALPKTTVNYHKTITMAGFNGLTGLSITNLTLMLDTQPDGANLAGLAHIPNPTVQTLDLGNLTLLFTLPPNITNTTDPIPIGTGTLNNTLVHPAPAANAFTTRATTNTTYLLSLLSREPRLLASGIPVLVTATNVTHGGQEIPWLSAALAQNTVPVNLDVGPALDRAGLGALIGGGSG